MKRHIRAIRPFEVVLMIQSAEEEDGICRLDRIVELLPRLLPRDGPKAESSPS